MHEPATRRDLSYIVFVSEPNVYDVGKLGIETAGGELPAGAMLLYPSTYLHRVEEVRAGTRFTVGWVQSLVRGAAQRELLFDLARGN